LGAGICGGSVGLISGSRPFSEMDSAPADFGALGVYAAPRAAGPLRIGIAFDMIDVILPWSYGQ
jgi:hypothetical protein